jgi:bifunctional non-homologous end joining protein LigD
MSRNGHDLANRFPQIVEAVRSLPVQSCVIDGEAIVTDDKGLFGIRLDPRALGSVPAISLPHVLRQDYLAHVMR